MAKELPGCPVEVTLQLIGNKWKVLIIRDLLDGTRRFSELKRSVTGITQKVLTANLRALEESGLLSRQAYAEIPPRVEYTLTAAGYSLKPVIAAMEAWGLDYKEGAVKPTPKPKRKKAAPKPAEPAPEVAAAPVELVAEPEIPVEAIAEPEAPIEAAVEAVTKAATEAATEAATKPAAKAKKAAKAKPAPAAEEAAPAEAAGAEEEPWELDSLF